MSAARRMLDVIPESECACGICVDMCRNTPCTPNPEEALRIMEAHGPKVLCRRVFGGVEHLSMARQDGSGGGDDPFYSIWSTLTTRKQKCIMLEGKSCKLHGTDMKPEEGRKALHLPNVWRSDYDEAYYEQMSVHELLMDLWDEELGKEVVKLWKTMVGYVESSET